MAFSVCKECSSRHKSIFSSLKGPLLDEILRARVIRNYDKKEIVHHQGNPSFGIFCIQSGLVKVVKTEIPGKQYIIRLAGPGDILGLPTLFTGIPYLWTAQVVEPATICFLPRDVVVKAAQEDKQMAEKIIQMLSRFVIESEKGRVELANGSARQRMAGLLVLLSSRCGAREKRGMRFNLPLSRREIADMVGLRSETAIRVLKEFREDQLLKINGNEIVIVDLARLEKLGSVTLGSVTLGSVTLGSVTDSAP